jgi:hypothetical protein
MEVERAELRQKQGANSFSECFVYVKRREGVLCEGHTAQVSCQLKATGKFSPHL